MSFRSTPSGRAAANAAGAPKFDMNVEWYFVNKEGQQVGPVNVVELHTAVRDGRTSAEKLCWNESMTGWMPISMSDGYQSYDSAYTFQLKQHELQYKSKPTPSGPSLPPGEMKATFVGVNGDVNEIRIVTDGKAEKMAKEERQRKLEEREKAISDAKLLQKQQSILKEEQTRRAREIAALQDVEDATNAAEKARKLEADRLVKLQGKAVRDLAVAQREEDSKLLQKLQERQKAAAMSGQMKVSPTPPTSAAALSNIKLKRAGIIPDEEKGKSNLIEGPDGDPKNWVELQTQEGVPYYFNRATNLTQWNKPDCLKSSEELDKVGQWVWMPHPEDAFVPAKKLSTFFDGRMELETEDGKTHIVAKTAVLEPLDWATLRKTAKDLVLLPTPSQPLLLHNLRTRYLKNEIYTSAGDILISVNPYKLLPLYTPNVIDAYRRNAREMPPHVFSIADKTYSDLIEHNVSQSIIITGESGAGKTEVAKQSLQYLAEVAGSPANVETKVLLANPILESFGNAKTVRNNNASRYGRYIELFFDSKAAICGSRTTNYMLEKSRVVSSTEGERNFHIFYQCCQGFDVMQRKVYQIGESVYYTYLNRAGAVAIEGVDDAADFGEVQSAMDQLGIALDERQSLFQMVAAILHLGNIRFKKVTDKTCAVEEKDPLFHAARLLEIKESMLLKSLTSRVVVTPNSAAVDVPLSQAEAQSARDSIAKFVYSRMFDWLVLRINDAIKIGDMKRGRSIGILDMFGFEIFGVNSFEQLIINFANERVQQQFNWVNFRNEEKMYDHEKIVYEHVPYTDNQRIVDLIELKPQGVLPMIDDELRIPKGTDVTLAAKFHTIHGNKKEFGRVLSKPDNFVIRHFAGDVQYDSTGFLLKNKDRLSEDLYELMQSSTSLFLRELFPREEDAGAMKDPLKKIAFGLKFKGQMDELIAVLNTTEPHYVRCMKPNRNKSPMEFNGTLIMQQLQYNGIFEAVKIRKYGFPFRLTHVEFYARYKCVRPGETYANAKIACEDLIDTMQQDPRAVQIGVTKVLYRAEQHREMELRRNLAIDDRVILIQKILRGFFARKLRKLLAHVKPYLKQAMLLKDLDGIDTALAAVGVLRFPLYEWGELKRKRIFVVEEKRLNDQMALLAIGDPEPKYDDIVQAVAQADEIGLKSELAERMRLRVVEVNEKRSARNLLREGIEMLDEFKIDDGLKLAVKWIMQHSEAELMEAAAASKERIIMEKQYMVALMKAITVGGYINDGDHIDWQHLDSLILQSTDFGLRMIEGVKILKLASILSELRKRMSIALGTKDKALWKAVEPILISAGAVPGAGEHPEIIRARNEVAHHAAVEDICDQIARAVEALNQDMVQFGLMQAQQLMINERRYPIVGIARIYLERIVQARRMLADAMASANIPILNDTLFFCESFGYETQETVEARTYRDNLMQLDVETQYALQQLEEDPMKDVIRRGGLLRFNSPELEKIREILEMTTPEKLLQMQLKAALALGDQGRAIRMTIKLKDLFFRKSSNLFSIENYPRLKKPDVWAMEKTFCIDRPGLALSMRRWNREPIHSSLCELGEMGEAALRRVKFACQVFKNVLGFCGDKSFGAQYALVTEVLTACIAHKWLRDELYCQLIKQLTMNPSKESASRCWHLMALCMETFPPNSEFENFLEMFIRGNAPADRKDFLLKTLHATAYGGERKVVLTEAEMKSIIAMQPNRSAKFENHKVYSPPRAIPPPRAEMVGVEGTTPLTIVKWMDQQRQAMAMSQTGSVVQSVQKLTPYEIAQREAAERLKAQQAMVAAQMAVEDRRKDLSKMQQGQKVLFTHQQQFQERVEEDTAVAQQQAAHAEYIAQHAHELTMNQSMQDQHINRPIVARERASQQMSQYTQSQKLREAQMWQMAFHPETGQPYYFHTVTNEVSWQPPPGFEQVQQMQSMQSMQTMATVQMDPQMLPTVAMQTLATVPMQQQQMVQYQM